MAMTVGARGYLKADVNMTPMIDVLLVLIIIFMVITPIAPKGLDVLVPQPSIAGTVPPTDEIIVTVRSDKSLQLNREPISLDKLYARLRGIFGASGNRVVFIRGEEGLEFQQIAEVIDIAKGAGAGRVGLMER
jgi:biopolymer transport protein TolR